MPSPILARADALMQRRRTNADADDVPVLTDAIDLSKPETDDDIPVLRDIEAGERRRPANKAAAPTSPPTPAKVAVPEEVPFPTLNYDDPVASPTPAVVVAAKAAPPVAKDVPPAAKPAPPAVSREDIARDIARRVQRRLVAELPRLITAAVNDYLAEQETTR
ncbi:MAG: hypothetical protein LBE81_02900 [Azonexus sp.]|jgi:hypothetical protein|uniref:hypothetical protein n=1 Tax=Azonexus sp. TaxID=1872668 RepID=UPI002829EC79|nr:hypothetical protein [Azonexus sp.]MDR0775569.1 hypothetical protein [Azonexus sp.]